MTAFLAQKFAEISIADEDVEFDERVSKFKSSFDLDLECLPKSRLQAVLDVLIGKLDNGFVLVDEEIQVNNLISYLSFKLGHIEDAFEYNKRALKKDRNNGIALANRARYHQLQREYFEADNDLKRLDGLYKNANAFVTTKLVTEGELAQSYARFGPKFHEKAIAEYETLFKNKSRVRKDLVVLWKYDYCLCLRRTLNLFNKMEYPERDPALTLQKACKTLVEIIDSSMNLPAYTARAWAELGQMVYQVERSPETFLPNTLEIIPLQKRFLSSEMYFVKALEIGTGDFDTMEVCAKFMRYFDKENEAVSLFERALVFRQTSLAYHHLALSLKKKEMKKTSIRNQQWRPNYAQFGRGGRRNPTLTPRQREQSNLKRSIKCGRKATPLQWNAQTQKILQTLEKACEKDTFNHFAAYDRAFILRQLQLNKEAKAEFCRLLNALEICELKVSCFEQAAYCCLDMAEANNVESKKHTYDGIRFLQKAIEIAAAVAAKVKYSSADVRPLIPTAKSMLTDPHAWETDDKGLQRLKNLLVEHGNLIPIINEARANKTNKISTLIEKCLCEDQQDEAAFLSIFELTEEIVSEPEESRFTEYLSTVLDNASAHLANGEHESAMTLYQIFIRLMGLRMFKDNREYDAFLMTDQETVNLKSMDRIVNWLKNYCGWNVVNSDEHCAFGQRVITTLTEFSLSSAVAFLILKDGKIDYLVEMVITSILSIPPEKPEKKPKLVILKDPSVELPPDWSSLPTFELPQQRDYMDSEVASWLTSLFRVVMS